MQQIKLYKTLGSSNCERCVLVCRQRKETALHFAAKFGQLSAAIYLVEQAEAAIDSLNEVRYTL